MARAFSASHPAGVALAILMLATSAHAKCGDSGFGTLAYVVTTCRSDGSSLSGSQELRILRSGCAPISVARIENSAPVPDPAGLCDRLARWHLGGYSPLAGVFHRLGVTLDGSGVVFEVTNAFQLVGKTPLSSEQEGFFYVRADGSGLRRLGPPSRFSTYRLYVDPIDGPAANVLTELAFSHDGRLAAYSDLGPGPDEVEREQLFIMDLRTGERRQVTRFPAAEPLPFGQAVIGAPSFLPHDRAITFLHHINYEAVVVTIRLDGREVSNPGLDVPPGGGGLVPRFGRSSKRIGIIQQTLPGDPVNDDVIRGPIVEVFRVVNYHDLVQLTDFRATDTKAMAARRAGVLVTSSADPLGANPTHNCQFFRVSLLGDDLRQLTSFGAGEQSREGCWFGPRAGCAISYVTQAFTTKPLLFYSDCDPLGTNPDGSQIFGIDWHGSLRQLTETAGVHRNADGTFEVEIPGPMARGGP
jgi:hypothetical protein